VDGRSGSGWWSVVVLVVECTQAWNLVSGCNDKLAVAN